jgi:spore germination protein
MSMTRRAHLKKLAGLGLGGSAFSLIPTVEAADSIQLSAYVAWWMPQSWRTAQFSQLSRIYFFGFDVEANGTIADKRGWPENWEDFARVANNSGKPLEIVLTVLDEKKFLKLFDSPLAINQLLQQSLAIAAHPSLTGLQLDVEVYGAIPGDTLDRYRQFVSQLSRELNRLSPRKTLSAFVPIGGKAPLYDRVTARSLSHVVVQAYDAHWLESAQAGPVAPLRGNYAVTWEKGLAHALGLGFKRTQISMSYPFYGYEWPTENVTKNARTTAAGMQTTLASVSNRFLPLIRTNVAQRSTQYTVQRDQESGSMWYAKTSPPLAIGWFEGEWSFEQKLSFASKEQLAGITVFVLGYDGGQLVKKFYLPNPATSPR